MDPRETARIVQVLAGGTDLSTSEPLPDYSLLSNSDTVKALRAAAMALRSGPLRKKTRELPAQAGKAWEPHPQSRPNRRLSAGSRHTSASARVPAAGPLSEPRALP
jgi:hypothetical protein